MPKHEFLTPKAIANRIKAKGLQKLRWYCQMCQKQCRDENGFKCHCESESHQRQLALFAERPDKFLDHFSEEFLEGFMDVVKRRYAKTRVLANVVYNDYIHDRHHVHMNSTKWETLTALVKWLGKEGYCTVDHTPKGWYLTYIDRDPVAIERQKALERKERADLDDEERQKKIIEKQIEEAARLRQEGEPEFTELQRDETDDAKVVFALASKGPDKPASKALPFESMLPPKPRPPALSNSSPLPKAGPSSDSESERQAASGALPREIKAESSRSGEKDTKRKISAAEELMLEEEKKKEKKKRRDHWLAPDIVVKVMNEKLAGGKYYKQKGVVEKVIDKYVAEVRMLDTGHRLRIDQEQLETVIPAVGGRVKVVNGAYAGETAVLQSIEVDKFCAQIKIDKGLLMGRVITAEYEDISKLFS